MDSRSIFLTISGQPITKEYGVPSIKDFSQGLSNITRYNGASIFPMNVAAHSILVYELCSYGDNTALMELYCLLHDTAECCTGDIPTPFKNPEIVATEEAILGRIIGSLGLPPITEEDWQTISKYDRMALQFEVHKLGCGGEGLPMYIDMPPSLSSLGFETRWNEFYSKLMDNSFNWAEYYEQTLRHLLAKRYNYDKSGYNKV